MDNLRAGINVASSIHTEVNGDPLSKIVINDNTEISYNYRYSDGVDQVYVKYVTVPASNSVVLDLKSGLLNRHVEAINFKTIYAVIVRLTPSNADALTVGPGDTDPVSITEETIGSGDTYLRVRNAGITVDATHKNLKLTNADDTAATAFVLIIGEQE